MKTPPYIKGLPIIGKSLEMAKDPVSFIQKQHLKHGDTVYINFLGQRAYLTSNPEIIKNALVTNRQNYKKDRAYEILKMALGNGLLTSSGSFWLKQRRLAQPAFHRKQLQVLFETMGEITEQYCKTFEKYRGGAPVDVSVLMTDVTADIAMRTLFNSDVDENLGNLYELMVDTQTYLIKRLRKPFLIPLMPITGDTRRFYKAKNNFDKIIYKKIEDRRKSKERYNDLLDMLMYTEDADTGERMSDEQLRDEIITIFAAGHETSANGMTWLWYILEQHPDVLQKVKTEVATIVGDKTPTFQDLRAMPYTRQVVDESLRMFPPAWAVARQLIDKEQIAGYELKENSILLMSVHQLHRHPDLWDNPNVFDPDRFSAERIKARPKHHYIPFGLGPRMCIGNNFALMEMQLLLAMFAHRFNFELVKGHPVEHEALITLRPKHGMMMKIS